MEYGALKIGHKCWSYYKTQCLIHVQFFFRTQDNVEFEGAKIE